MLLLNECVVWRTIHFYKKREYKILEKKKSGRKRKLTDDIVQQLITKDKLIEWSHLSLLERTIEIKNEFNIEIVG